MALQACAMTGKEAMRGCTEEEGEVAAPVQHAPARRPQAALMCAYALAAWAWRSWDFFVALVLIDLAPAPASSLRLVSAYGLADNLARLTLGASVGDFVGRCARQVLAQACAGAALGASVRWRLCGQVRAEGGCSRLSWCCCGRPWQQVSAAGACAGLNG